MNFDLTVGDLKRFWSNIHFPDGSGCWEWRGNFTSDKGSSGRMPQFHVHDGTTWGQKVSARRISYFIHLGTPPVRIIPSCGNSRCVNPRHMLQDLDEAKVVKVVTTTPRKATFTDATARKIILLRKLGRSQAKIAKETGVTQSVVSYVLKMATYCDTGVLKQKGSTP